MTRPWVFLLWHAALMHGREEPPSVCSSHFKYIISHSRCQNPLALFMYVMTWRSWTLGLSNRKEMQEEENQHRLPLRQSVLAQKLSHIRLFATPWTVAHQASLFIGFLGQKYWNGLPFLTPWDLPDPGIKPVSLVLLHWQADSLPVVPPGKKGTHH